MLVTVSTHLDPTDAHIMRCRLEAEGIAAFVAHEHHVRLNWFYATALGGAKVQVAVDDADAALKVVEAVARGEYALPDEPGETRACPRCRSTDVAPDQMTRGASLWSSFLLSIPLPFTRHRWRCRTCGHAGNEGEFGIPRVAVPDGFDGP